MRRRVLGLMMLPVAAAVLILGRPATAGDSLPFKSQSSGVDIIAGIDPVNNIVYLSAAGSGESTYLGHFTSTSTISIFLVTGLTSQVMTLTGANGDTLILMGDDGHGTDPTHATALLHIVGGTGRFKGASGTVRQNITFGVAVPHDGPVPFTDTMEGTITFDSK